MLKAEGSSVDCAETAVLADSKASRIAQLPLIIDTTHAFILTSHPESNTTPGTGTSVLPICTPSSSSCISRPTRRSGAWRRSWGPRVIGSRGILRPAEQLPAFRERHPFAGTTPSAKLTGRRGGGARVVSTHPYSTRHGRFNAAAGSARCPVGRGRISGGGKQAQSYGVH